MTLAAREVGRLIAWLMLTFAAGATVSLGFRDAIGNPPSLNDQYRIIGFTALCWYGWWKLK